MLNHYYHTQVQRYIVPLCAAVRYRQWGVIVYPKIHLYVYTYTYIYFICIQVIYRERSMMVLVEVSRLRSERYWDVVKSDYLTSIGSARKPGTYMYRCMH